MQSITRRRLILLAAVSLAVPSAWPQGDEKTTAARSFVDAMYKLLDDGKYSEMYQQFHSTMRSQLSEQKWVETAASVAKQTGKNSARTLKTRETERGMYKFVFDSRYEAGRATDEIYVAEENGSFKIAGIFVKPAA